MIDNKLTMDKWAILSGVEGNLAAYEAVLNDIKSDHPEVTELFILGDLIGQSGDNEATVVRVQKPRPGELEPQVCIGWWEEQCFSLHGTGALVDAPELLAEYGAEAVKQLYNSLSREAVQWLQSLDFGFYELDCLLIHGSTISYSDKLTPNTPAIDLCDRLIRAEANNLFCGRSGLAFEAYLETGSIQSTETTLERSNYQEVQTIQPRRVIGVGNVGCTRGKAIYTIYQPANNQVIFQTVDY